VRDGAEVLDQLLLAHADARVGDGQRVVARIGLDLDLESHRLIGDRLADHLAMAQLQAASQ